MIGPLRYGVLETCLMRMHGIDEKLRRRFGARIRHLCKLHLLGKDAHPGKGTRYDYTADQIYKIIFAIELEQVGMAPHVIARITNDLWAPIGASFAKDSGAPGPDDFLVALVDMRMATAGNGVDPFRIESFRLRELPRMIHHSPMLLFSISASLRAFTHELAHLRAAKVTADAVAGLMENFG